MKEGKNQKTVLRTAEIERIIDTFTHRKEEDDFSVLVSYADMEEKNCSFSAGQYFEVKIEYMDITPEEFRTRMDTYMTSLSQHFHKGRELEDSILKQLGGLEYGDD